MDLIIDFLDETTTVKEEDFNLIRKVLERVVQQECIEKPRFLLHLLITNACKK